MARLPCLAVWLTLNTLVLAACSDDSTPTQPESAGNPTVSAPSFSAASNAWSSRAALPIPVGSSLGVIPNSAGTSIVYAFGGTDGEEGFTGYAIEAYDPATDAWTQKTPEVSVTDLNGVGLIGSKLYYSGGFQYHSPGASYSNQLFAYDPVADVAVEKAHMPKYTDEGITGVIAGKLFVLPGVCSGEGWPAPGYCDESATRELYRYNPVNNSWNSRHAAPHAHPRGAGAVIGGKFYVVGGANASLDVYDPMTNKWKTLAPMPKAGYGQAAVLGNKLYVVESTAGNGGTTVPHLYVYNPATNKWATKAAPPHIGPLAKVTLNGHNYLFLASSQGSELYTP